MSNSLCVTPWTAACQALHARTDGHVSSYGDLKINQKEIADIENPLAEECLQK